MNDPAVFVELHINPAQYKEVSTLGACVLITVLTTVVDTVEAVLPVQYPAFAAVLGFGVCLPVYLKNRYL